MTSSTSSASPRHSSRLVVAAAVLDSLSRPTAMLCAARSYPAEHAGQYELPGGKVEPGETPVEALARELSEEISLSVRLGAEVVPTSSLAVPAPPTTPAPATGPAGPDTTEGAGPAGPSPAVGSRSATDPSPAVGTAPDWPDDDQPAWPAMHGYRMRVWLAEPTDPARGPERGSAHQSLEWVRLEQARALPWLPADLPILDAVLAALLPAGPTPTETC